MARVSLILPRVAGDPSPAPRLADLRGVLEEAGHEVELLVAADASAAPLAGEEEAGGFVLVTSPYAGLAAAAIAGLERSSGEMLIVLDLAMGYGPEDLVRVLGPLVAGRTEIAVASRWAEPSGGLGRLLRPGFRLIRPLLGTTDPLTGLIALTRDALDGAARFQAVGMKFSFELLAKLTGKREDVPVHVGRANLRRLPGWDDLRHLKRIADHRFGNLSRLVQFCAVGGSGAIIDLLMYAVFQVIYAAMIGTESRVPPTRVPVYLALAGGSAVVMALTWNFALNRRLTFSYARRGSILKQYLTYAASNALGVAVSLALRLALPGRVQFFRDHKLAAAVVGIVAATGISFSMSRWVVFRHRDEETEESQPDAAEPGDPDSSGDGAPAQPHVRDAYKVVTG